MLSRIHAVEGARILCHIVNGEFWLPIHADITYARKSQGQPAIIPLFGVRSASICQRFHYFIHKLSLIRESTGWKINRIVRTHSPGRVPLFQLRSTDGREVLPEWIEVEGSSSSHRREQGELLAVQARRLALLQAQGGHAHGQRGRLEPRSIRTRARGSGGPTSVAVSASNDSRRLRSSSVHSATDDMELHASVLLTALGRPVRSNRPVLAVPDGNEPSGIHTLPDEVAPDGLGSPLRQPLVVPP